MTGDNIDLNDTVAVAEKIVELAKGQGDISEVPENTGDNLALLIAGISHSREKENPLKWVTNLVTLAYIMGHNDGSAAEQGEE